MERGRGRKPGRKRAKVGQVAGGDGRDARVKRGQKAGEELGKLSFFMTFSFFKQTIKSQNQRILISYFFN